MNPLDDPQIRLSRLARELASTDLAECERVIRSMTDMDLRGPTGTGIAERMAKSDPLGAARIAKAIPNARGEGYYDAAKAMVTVAWTAAGTDKTLGRSLFDDAERLANSIMEEGGKEAALDLLHKWKAHRGL